MARSPKDPGEGDAAAPPKPRRRSTRSAAPSDGAKATPAKPRRRTTRKATAAEAAPVAGAAASAAEPTDAVAMPPAPEPETTPPAAAPPDRGVPQGEPGRLRGIAAWILTVLAAIAVTASVIAFWVHETVLDTDRFIAAVTPAVESEAVHAVVADRLSDELLQALDLETRIGSVITEAGNGVSEALADALGLSEDQVARLDRLDLGLQRLAAPIAAGVETRVREAVDRFVSSVAGNDRLLALVAAAHERTVHLLRDELDQLPNIVIEEGQVRLNLVPMLAETLRSVVNQGIGAIGIEREIPPFTSNEDAEQAVTRLATILGRDLPPDFGQVELMSQDQLENAQGLVKTFDRLVWVLLVLAIVLAVLAVVLAPTVTSGLVRTGVAVAIAIVLGWVGIELISSRLAEAARTADGATAIAELTNAVVATLQPVIAALAIIGIGVAAAALITARNGWSMARGVDEGA